MAAKKIPDIIAREVSRNAKNISNGSSRLLLFSGKTPARRRKIGIGATVTQNIVVMIAADFLPSLFEIIGAIKRPAKAEAKRGS